jgi:hypothetical protein
LSIAVYGLLDGFFDRGMQFVSCGIITNRRGTVALGSFALGLSGRWR